MKSALLFFLLAAAGICADYQLKATPNNVVWGYYWAGAKPVRREGEREGRWVLLDYADLIVHVQQAEEREYYALERLWKDCPQIALPEPVRGAAGAGEAR